MFTLTVDRRQKVLHVRVAGVLTDSAIADFDAATRTFLRSEGPHRRIMDMSDVTRVDIPHELLISRATNIPTPTGMTPARIFVTPTAYLYAMARMFTTYQIVKDAPPTRVVRSLAEAHTLLAIDAPDFQPVTVLHAAA